MFNIKKLGLTLVLTVVSIGMIACGGTTTTETNKANTAANKAETAANKAENAANKAETAANKAENAANKAADDKKDTASTGEKTGIAVCDEFIEKYEACIMSKMPEAGRAAAKSSIDQWRKSWKTLADNPQTKATLEGTCKTTLDQTKAATQAYGCTW